MPCQPFRGDSSSGCFPLNSLACPAGAKPCQVMHRDPTGYAAHMGPLRLFRTWPKWTWDRLKSSYSALSTFKSQLIVHGTWLKKQPMYLCRAPPCYMLSHWAVQTLSFFIDSAVRSLLLWSLFYAWLYSQFCFMIYLKTERKKMNGLIECIEGLTKMQ